MLAELQTDQLPVVYRKHVERNTNALTLFGADVVSHVEKLLSLSETSLDRAPVYRCYTDSTRAIALRCSALKNGDGHIHKRRITFAAHPFFADLPQHTPLFLDTHLRVLLNTKPGSNIPHSYAASPVYGEKGSMSFRIDGACFSVHSRDQELIERAHLDAGHMRLLISKAMEVDTVNPVTTIDPLNFFYGSQLDIPELMARYCDTHGLMGRRVQLHDGYWQLCTESGIGYKNYTQEEVENILISELFEDPRNLAKQVAQLTSQTFSP